MVSPLEQLFPALARSDYRITSPANNDYNCIAWAVGEVRNWWWPGPDPVREYWPADVVREVTIAAFQAAFASRDYVVCNSEEVEPGFEKVALFASADGKPQHAARQLLSGRWTSKLGKAEDIEHALHDLEGTIYGSVAMFLKRPIGNAAFAAHE